MWLLFLLHVISWRRGFCSSCHCNSHFSCWPAASLLHVALARRTYSAARCVSARRGRRAATREHFRATSARDVSCDASVRADVYFRAPPRRRPRAHSDRCAPRPGLQRCCRALPGSSHGARAKAEHPQTLAHRACHSAHVVAELRASARAGVPSVRPWSRSAPRTHAACAWRRLSCVLTREGERLSSHIPKAARRQRSGYLAPRRVAACCITNARAYAL
jgi:hypothetical protein